MIDLRFPWALALLPPLLFLVWHRAYRWGIPASRPSSRLGRVSARMLPSLLAALLVLAASGPEWRQEVRGLAPVIDFAVVLDGSSSMQAIDDVAAGPKGESRWDAARRLLRAFIARRPEDRFALVLFSAHPVTLSPLTADHGRLLGTLGHLDLTARDDGTAIGSALMTAVRRLQSSPARSRVILLLTDGAQNRGRVEPLEAAEEAKRQGIRVHTVLLGRSGDSLMPIQGGGYARVHVDTDPATLKAVADATGGEAFSAEDPGGLARSLGSIDHLEKTSLPVDAPSEGRPLAQWLLLAAAAAALPLAADLLRKRGRKAPAWLNPSKEAAS